MGLFGIGGSPDGKAQEYINKGQLSVRVENFSGTLAQLNETISRETDECSRWVKSEGFLRSQGASRDACSNAINNYYAPAINRLQSESYNEESAIKNEFLAGPTRIIVFAVLIVLFIIFFT